MIIIRYNSAPPYLRDELQRITGCGLRLDRWCTNTHMPIGPQGQKRPADAVGCAVHVMKIATGEIEESPPVAKQPARASGGRAGGKARAARLSPTKRSEIASQAAKARWRRAASNQ